MPTSRFVVAHSMEGPLAGPASLRPWAGERVWPAAMPSRGSLCRPYSCPNGTCPPDRMATVNRPAANLGGGEGRTAVCGSGGEVSFLGGEGMKE